MVFPMSTGRHPSVEPSLRAPAQPLALTFRRKVAEVHTPFHAGTFSQRKPFR